MKRLYLTKIMFILLTTAIVTWIMKCLGYCDPIGGRHTMEVLTTKDQEHGYHVNMTRIVRSDVFNIQPNVSRESVETAVQVTKDREINHYSLSGIETLEGSFDDGSIVNGSDLEDNTLDEEWSNELASEDLETTRKTPRKKDCPGNSDRSILYDLLSVWNTMATQHGIAYYIFYGSLLGYYRNGDVLPWDSDVDVAVDARLFSRIRDLAVPRTFKYIARDKIARLVVQTDLRFPSENRTRVSCGGRVVSRSVDGCSFQDPIARVVRGNRHLDIFAVYQMNRTFFYEPILNHSFDISELYPLRSCTFIGLETRCPSMISTLLERTYGANFEIPVKICVDGKWRDRKSV